MGLSEWDSACKRRNTEIPVKREVKVGVKAGVNTGLKTELKIEVKREPHSTEKAAEPTG
jgi:hypothetical protein